jgi:guanine deaminase
MSIKILRGRVLSFLSEPKSIDDKSSYVYFENGAVAIKNGKIIGLGEYDEIAKNNKNAKIIDHRPHLIMAGFIDPHIHYVQMQVVASYAANLLEWLNKYTFIEEQKFTDENHATLIASAFFDEMINVGTTTVSAFCSSHSNSADAFFSEAQKRNMAMIGGKVMMDRNCPDALQDTAQTGYDESKALIDKWHGQGRLKYAITPRFAITSSPEQLEAAGALLSENPSCYLQTHLSENDAEIALTKELYPKHKDYLSIYAHYELLGEKSLFAHSIHLSENEMALMADSNSVAVSCPTSNLFLGSGLYNLEAMQKAGVRSAVATDIGGGTSYSMLKTMDEFYKVQQLNNNRLNPLLAFYMLTLGNACALSLENEIGNLAVGSDADIIVLNSSATPAMALRAKTINKLSEELFLLQTMGDDRVVEQTYVAGKAMKVNFLKTK